MNIIQKNVNLSSRIRCDNSYGYHPLHFIKARYHHQDFITIVLFFFFHIYCSHISKIFNCDHKIQFVILFCFLYQYKAVNVYINLFKFVFSRRSRKWSFETNPKPYHAVWTSLGTVLYFPFLGVLGLCPTMGI